MEQSPQETIHFHFAHKKFAFPKKNVDIVYVVKQNVWKWNDWNTQRPLRA